MKCVFAASDLLHRSGKKLLKCRRLGCRQTAIAITGKTVSSPNCQGWPLPHETREWLALFSAAFGITGAIHLCQYIRWRFGGSKIEELPPGIPRPSLPPKYGGLTNEQVAELFPGETDPTLIGNRIAALTKALGIPPCGACDKRRKWLNQAHEWLRGKTGQD